MILALLAARAASQAARAAERLMAICSAWEASIMAFRASMRDLD